MYTAHSISFFVFATMLDILCLKASFTSHQDMLAGNFIQQERHLNDMDELEAHKHKSLFKTALNERSTYCQK